MPVGELDAYGRKVWRRLIPLLHEAGLLTRLDREKLTRYCQLRSRYAAMDHFLSSLANDEKTSQMGECFIETRSSGKSSHRILKRWPHSSISLDLHKALSALESEFGMDPSARARVVVPSVKTKGLDMGKARFFKGGVA